MYTFIVLAVSLLIVFVICPVLGICYEQAQKLGRKRITLMVLRYSVYKFKFKIKKKFANSAFAELLRNMADSAWGEKSNVRR